MKDNLSTLGSSSTFGSGSSSPPLIEETISGLAQGTTYDVQVQLMLTDLSWSMEYATITINGENFGDCDGGNTCDGCCTWYTCNGLDNMNNNQITPSTTSITVKLAYTTHVSSTYAKCTDSVSGEMGGGVARIILTPASKMIFQFSLVSGFIFIS